MFRSYKFRMYPTSKQEVLLRAMLDDHRSLYNAALQERREAWKRGKQVWFADQDAQLTAIRAIDPDHARWSYSAQEQTLRRLDRAFMAFFRRIRAGEKKVGYPRFKGPRQFHSVEHRNGDGAKWDSVQHPTQTRAKFQGVGHIKVNQHRPVAGRVKTLSVQREGKRWYLHLVAEQELPAPLEKTGGMIGIDLATGPNGLAYTSLGERIDNPAFGAAASTKIAAAQRQVFRCRRGSKRRYKAWDKVSGLYRRARNQRHDYLHKTARRLVKGYDVIVAEDLRTVVQHAWAEIEHDLGYKQDTIPEPMSRRFSMLAGVLELVDYEFMALRDQLEKYERDADQAAMTKTTDMSLDLATLSSIIKHDDALYRLDKEIAASAHRGLRVGPPDNTYLEKRLQSLRSVGVNSITEVRQALETWRLHVLEFAPLWIESRNEKRRQNGVDLSLGSSLLPKGVSFFYLWLAMGLEAKTKGYLPPDEILREPGADEIWAETIAAVGTPPELPPRFALHVN